MPECLDILLQVSKETGEASVAVQEEASAILEEMAHRLQLGTVRFFAFTLAKTFKTLFRSICVNEEGIQRVSSIQARLKSCISSPDRMDTGIQTQSDGDICKSVKMHSHAIYVMGEHA